MTGHAADDDRGFLRRWSQRKLAAAREAQATAPAAPAAPLPAAPPAAVGVAALPVAAPVQSPDEAPAPPALPAVDTLTFDSDFRAFLSPEVEEGTRRAALRKLFSDPRFNVQDGLDVYIDDYNKFVPMTPEIVSQLAHARYLFDPPKTRINEQGWVEDVPPEEVAQAATDAEAADAASEAATPEADTDKPVDRSAKNAPGQADMAPPAADGGGEGTEPGRRASESAAALPPTATLPTDLPARAPVPPLSR